MSERCQATARAATQLSWGALAAHAEQLAGNAFARSSLSVRTQLRARAATLAATARRHHGAAGRTAVAELEQLRAASHANSAAILIFRWPLLPKNTIRTAGTLTANEWAVLDEHDPRRVGRLRRLSWVWHILTGWSPDAAAIAGIR